MSGYGLQRPAAALHAESGEPEGSAPLEPPSQSVAHRQHHEHRPGCDAGDVEGNGVAEAVSVMVT